jgi:hypothetical protein
MRNKTYKIPFHILVLLFGIFLAIPNSLEGQQVQDRLQDIFTPGIYGSNVANYYFAQPGDFTMLVSVWGQVGRSGRYEVPIDTNIGDLLSLAGGPGADVRGTVGADTWSRRQAGTTIVRLSRLTGGASREIILELRIDDLLKLRERDVPLQDGDIIMIDRIRPFNIWDIFTVISTSGTLILLLDRIFGIF